MNKYFDSANMENAAEYYKHPVLIASKSTLEIVQFLQLSNAGLSRILDK